MPLNPLEKTELWVTHITLVNVDLNDLADTVGEVLGMEKGKVLVVDVRPDHITFDILETDIREENLLGKEEALLGAIGKFPGVTLTDESFIHSNGILGLVCLDTENPKEILDRIDEMSSEIRSRISKRAIVFPTGFELRQKLIEDTNTPFLKELLESKEFKVTVGEIIEDDTDDIAFRLSEAIDRGFGLVVTTGGVGAEDKDKTVEGILQQDPKAATPYIVKFTQGTGRHVKDGVRIAVGRVGVTTLVALPGPNDEVRCAAPVMLSGLESGWDKERLAAELAAVLAEKWMRRNISHGHIHAKNK